jgi:hypothetical protein
VNTIGNAVAAIAVARWDNDFDAQRWRLATRPTTPET